MRRFRMKTLLSIALILIATTVFATPFLVSDPQSGVTSYQLTGWSETNVVAQADGSLRMDVGSAVQGTTYNLTIAACNVWGCSTTVPFDLVRRAVPSVPSGTALVP
jgi:ribosomal protein S18 acetylase RimI-like enzyme